MDFLRNLSITRKLALLVGIAVAGLVLFAAIAFIGFKQTSVGSDMYLRNRVAMSISRFVDHTSSVAGQTADACDQLSRLAHELRRHSERFKVPAA